MNRFAPLVTCSLITSFCAGCYTTRWVHPSQLAQLQDSQEQGRTTPDRRIPDEKEASAKSDPAKGRTDHGSEHAQAGGVGPQAAEKLNPPVHRRQLVDMGGDAIELKPGVKLYVHLLNGEKVGGDVSNTAFRNGQFIWEAKPGSEVAVPIKEVKSAEVDVPDIGKPIVAFVGGTVGVILVVVGILLVNAAGHGSGRPLRIQGRIVVARARESTDWLAPAPMPSTTELSADARAVLASAWLRDARDEHASVPAFSRISLTLVALGAPSRLVELAQQAALQEIEHARRTFALASAYSERTVGPGPLPELLTEASGYDGTAAKAICRLAGESLADGCLGEGLAAALAREACTRARDPAVRETLAVIARDEAAHAEFSWELVSWCLAVGGEDARDKLRARLSQLPRAIDLQGLPHVAAGVETELEHHGRLGAAIHHRVFQETRVATVARASLLLEQSAAPHPRSVPLDSPLADACSRKRMTTPVGRTYGPIQAYDAPISSHVDSS